VPLDDAADGGQADAGAFEFVVPVQALEHPEQLAGIAHVEADAVVPNEDVLRALGDADADLDHRVRSRTRVLHGVVDQVGEYLQHQIGIAGYRRQRRQPPLDDAFTALLPHLIDRALDQLVERGDLATHLHVADPGQCQQSVDQRAHLASAARDLVEMDQRLACRRRTPVVSQHLHVRVNQP
jgi:hypothetical protein